MTVTRPSRGVALLDALAGFALLSLALLSVLRWQATAHLDARLARERAAAASAARDTLEQLRAFDAVDPEPGRVAFADIADREAPATGEAPWSTRLDVLPDANARLKLTSVVLRWPDAGGEARELAVHTALDASLPVHSAALLVPAPPGPTAQVDGRAPVLPPDTRPVSARLGTWSPAEPAGAASPPLYLVDLLTGAVTGLCPPGVASPSPDTCPAFRGTWLGGYLNVADGALAPDLRVRVVNLADDRPVACGLTPVVDAEGHEEAETHAVRYTCAVPWLEGRSTWSARLELEVAPASNSTGRPARAPRLCALGSSAAVRTDGGVHAVTFVDRTGPVLQQNFLMIRGDAPCPHNVGSDPDNPPPPT